MFIYLCMRGYFHDATVDHGLQSLILTLQTYMEKTLKIYLTVGL